MNFSLDPQPATIHVRAQRAVEMTTLRMDLLSAPAARGNLLHRKCIQGEDDALPEAADSANGLPLDLGAGT
jgi:hypothetical protein